MHSPHIEHPLCAKPHSRTWDRAGSETEKAPAFMELILYGGKRVDNEQANNKIATRFIMGYKETDRGRSGGPEQINRAQRGPPWGGDSDLEQEAAMQQAQVAAMNNKCKGQGSQ